jgi:hypothetical protein
MALGIDLYIYIWKLLLWTSLLKGLLSKMLCNPPLKLLRSDDSTLTWWFYHKIDWLVKKTVFRNVLYATKKYGNLLYATKKNALETFSCKRQIFF